VPRDWDATTYDRIADPQFRWGVAVVERMDLADGETVLDAGCGSGRVTEALLERFPQANVVALDGSPSMLEQARARLEPFADRVAFVEADLHEPLPVDPVDAVFSTATFHWIQDHDTLFARMYAALVDGGRFEAQCGGGHNIARVHAVARDVARNEQYADDLYDVEGVTNFYTPEQTEERLRAAGFTDVRCWLRRSPSRPTIRSATCARSSSARTWSASATTSEWRTCTKSRKASDSRATSRSTTCGSTSRRVAHERVDPQVRRAGR